MNKQIKDTINSLPDDTEFICPVCHTIFDKQTAIDFDGLGCCADNGQIVELRLK